MKINTLLNESGSAVLAYRDLETSQLIMLQRAVAGKVSDENASGRERAILDQLAMLGLVNDLDYSPTERGIKAAELHTRYGARDAAAMQRRAKVTGSEGGFDANRRYSDVGDSALDTDTETTDISSGARAIDRGEVIR